MRVRKILFYVAAVVGFVFSFSFPIDATPAAWPVYRVDALQYATNHLPSPIMIYVYTSDTKLVGILSAHGDTRKPALDKIGKMIAGQHFSKPSDAQLATTAKSFKYFMLDEGYDLHKIVSNKSKYTLILTGWVVKTTECSFYTDIQNRYKTLVSKFLPKPVGGAPVYSVAIVKTESPKLTFDCAK